MRVSVLEDATSISLKVSGGYEIVEPGTKKVLAVGTDLKTTVTTFRNFIVLGKISVEGSRVLIRQTGVEPIMINDRQFKGGIELLKKGSAISAIKPNSGPSRPRVHLRAAAPRRRRIVSAIFPRAL